MSDNTPDIPSLSSQVPSEVRRAFDAVRSWMRTIRRGGGVVTQQQAAAAGWSESGPEVPGALIDYSIPPQVTGLQAVGGFNAIMLSWTQPADVAYVEVWRSTTDDLGEAVLIGTATSGMYTDQPPDSRLSVTYYYWVRAVSRSVPPVYGPFNATSGTAGSTADEPGYLLELLSGEITESELHGDLSERIDLIDAPSTGLVTRIGQAEQQINAMSAEIAELSNTPSYDNAETYSEGDLVTYDGGLYRALQTTTGNVPTNATYWEKVGDYSSLGEAVTALSAEISDLDIRVSTAESTISSTASSLNTLASAVNHGTTGLAAAHTNITNLSTTVSGKVTVIAQTSAPSTSGRTIGDLWLDTDDANKLYRWSGSAWVSAQDTSRNKTFYQTAAPSSGMVAGDMWFDSDDGNKQYRYSGSNWIAVDDARVASTASSLSILSAQVNHSTTGLPATYSLLTTSYSTTAAMDTAIATAKSEAIASANGNTATQLQSYTNTTGMNSAITTAQSAAVATANANTASQLANYTNTVGMNSAISTATSTLQATVNGTFNRSFKSAVEPVSPTNGINLLAGDIWVDEGSTNLLTYSQDFRNTADAGATRPTGYGQLATVSHNYGVAPDGTTTTALVSDPNTVNYSSINRTVGSYTAGDHRCFSCYVKKDSIGKATRFPIFRLIFAGTLLDCAFDTSTGEIVVRGSTSYSLGYGAVDCGDHWRIWFAGYGPTTGTLYWYCYPAVGSGLLTSAYSLATTGSVEIWGAQLEDGSAPGRYIPTAAAAVSTVGNNTTYMWQSGRWVEATNAQLPTNTAAIQTEQQVRAISTGADWSSSTAYTVAQVVVYGGSLYQCILGHTNQVPPNATYWKPVTSSLYAQYMVKTDVNGKVAGFGLANDGATSTFEILADKFAVADPAGSATSKVPFIVSDGKVVMDEALIGDASITTAKIGSAAIITDHLGYIALSTNNMTISTPQLTVDSSGNAIFGGNLDAASGTFTGALVAASGTFTGALVAASGTFGGSLLAGVLQSSSFDSYQYMYYSAGTFQLTIPALKSGWQSMLMRITLHGAGGGGAGVRNLAFNQLGTSGGGGGGGAGARIVYQDITVSPGQVLTIVVGAGGAGGGSTDWRYTTTGANGGATYCSINGTTYSVTAGAGGVNNAGGSIGGGDGTTVWSDNFGEFVDYGGSGGSSLYGQGGIGPNIHMWDNPLNGTNATGYGAGGGGAGGFCHTWVNTGAGGNGSGGFVMVDLYDPNMLVLNTRYAALITWLDSVGHGSVPPGAR